MTKTKSTKRALLTSAVCLMVCVAMLIGSTYAWFTDSVVSGRNTIQSGNLDVELEYSTDGENWAPVDSTTKLFNDGALWEPGYTEMVYLRVSNKGSLALKYQLTVDVYNETPGVNVYGEEFLLSESLKYGVVTEADFATLSDRISAVEKAITTMNGSFDVSGALEDLGLDNGWGQLIGAVSTERVLESGESNATALILTMPTSVGNEANHNGEDVPSIEFGINLVATQAMYEEDDFGDDYDEDATLPVVVVKSAEDLKSALTTGGNIVVMNDIELSEPTTIPANVTVALDLNGATVSAPRNVIVNNGTLSVYGEGTLVGAATYALNNTGTLTVDDVTVSGGIFNGGELTVNSGTIANTTTDKHTVYHGGSALTINGGSFENTSKNEVVRSNSENVTINGGTFVMTGKSYLLGGNDIVINGGNFVGYVNADGTNDKMRSGIVVKGGTFNFDPTSFAAKGYTVTDNGDGTWTVSAAKVSSAAELSNAIANGKVAVLTEDVQFGSTISKDAVIDLAGNEFEATTSYKLSNNADLTMTDGDYVVNGTFGHVDVRPTSVEGSVVTFENVDFANYKKSNTYGPSTNRLGSVVEFCAETAGGKAVFVFKNCTFDNAQVVFEGMSGKTGEFEATFENCTFNALTSSAPIYVQNYVSGTINVIGCTFNLECTSSTASAISISSSSSTTVTLNAENNTLNAEAATPYTYDESKGEDSTYTVKVNGTPANIKFVSGGTNSTINETNTVMTGIAAN